MNSEGRSHAQTIWHFIAVLSLSVAILSYVSPQVGMLGRGLRTTLPALTISFLSISLVSPAAFFRAFARNWKVYVSGFIFLVQAALRFSMEDYDAQFMWSTYFVGPLMALTFLLWISSLSELGDTTLSSLRSWLLFGWCLSLALGLPVLITHPKIARLTMGNAFARQHAAQWAPYGIGEYSVYTSAAICLAPLLSIALLRMKGLKRLAAVPLVCMAAAAVLVSTFTMAAVLLVLSVFAMVFAWAMTSRGIFRLLRFLLATGILAMLLFLYSQVSSVDQIQFLTEKVERIYKGVEKSGLEKGDDTGRGKMLADEMRSFAENPILGYIPNVQGKRGHGHSSFGDSLAFFGLFGSILWCGILYGIFRDSLRNTADALSRKVLLIGWSVLVLGGLLNPTWHAPTALGTLFALTFPSRKKHPFPCIQHDNELSIDMEHFTEAVREV